jgi:hypothetical protein
MLDSAGQCKTLEDNSGQRRHVQYSAGQAGSCRTEQKSVGQR